MMDEIILNHVKFSSPKKYIYTLDCYDINKNISDEIITSLRTVYFGNTFKIKNNIDCLTCSTFFNSIVPHRKLGNESENFPHDMYGYSEPLINRFTSGENISFVTYKLEDLNFSKFLKIKFIYLSYNKLTKEFNSITTEQEKKQLKECFKENNMHEIKIINLSDLLNKIVIVGHLKNDFSSTYVSACDHIKNYILYLNKIQFWTKCTNFNSIYWTGRHVTFEDVLQVKNHPIKNIGSLVEYPKVLGKFKLSGIQKQRRQDNKKLVKMIVNNITSILNTFNVIRS